MNLDLSGFDKFQRKSTFDDSFSILDETDDFLIICKKSGIPVQATDKEKMDLETYLNKKVASKVYVLNRIDQPVSGLIIFGKNKEFTDAFTTMLKNREVSKKYIALVSGEPNKVKTTLTHFIKKLHNRAMTSDEPIDTDYKEAVLEYTLLQSFDNYHALLINLKTGRFHQIRAQLATMGMSIKGDLKYGSRRPNLDKSIGLLSYKLEFVHPSTQKFYSYTSPFPTNEILWDLLDKTLL
ncbi:MAG: RNA pseudouridine synthase [Saprospiraceae bacterium]